MYFDRWLEKRHSSIIKVWNRLWSPSSQRAKCQSLFVNMWFKRRLESKEPVFAMSISTQWYRPPANYLFLWRKDCQPKTMLSHDKYKQGQQSRRCFYWFPLLERPIFQRVPNMLLSVFLDTERQSGTSPNTYSGYVLFFTKLILSPIDRNSDNI